MLQFDTGSPGKEYSGPRLCPAPITFDVNEPLHLDYIWSAANLKAEVYGITQIRDRAQVVEMVAKVEVPELKPKSGVRIAVTDAGLQNDHNNDVRFDSQRINDLKNEH